MIQVIGGRSPARLRLGQWMADVLGQQVPQLIVWETLNGPLTAAQLRQNILAREPDGLQWLSSTFRLIRDLEYERARAGLRGSQASAQDLATAALLDSTPIVRLVQELPAGAAVAYLSATDVEYSREGLALALREGSAAGHEYIGGLLSVCKELLRQRQACG